MLIEKYIDPEIPVLKTTDTVRTAIKKFDQANVDQLPVAAGETFEGILLRDTAESVIEGKSKLEGIRLEGKGIVITSNLHVLEVLRLTSNSQLEVFAILDNDRKVIGALKRQSLMRYFSDSYGVKSSGSVIVLSLLERDYSLFELSRLVEANGAKVNAVLTEIREDDPYTLLVTLKINLADLSRIIAALQRHNFNIIYSFHQEEYESKDKERLEHLLRFLEI